MNIPGRDLWRMFQLLVSIWLVDGLVLLLIARPLIDPPQADLVQLFILMGGSGSVSLLLAFLVYRLVHWFRSLRYGLISLSILTISVVFFNVWFLAQAMFIDDHDLGLTSVLLVFAAWIALGSSYFIAFAFTRRITRLAAVAGRLAAGDLTARVSVAGNDELAGLATAFNVMAQRLQANAEQRARLEQSRRDLIAWASHDLRTPLASLQLVVDAMIDGVVDDEATRQRYLRTAQAEIGNLSELINDLFELSQLESGHINLNIQRTSLSDLLSDTLSTLRPLAERRGVQLDGHVSSAIDPVLIDPEKIHRVLYNLITNAIRHTPAAGRVMLTASIEGDSVRVSVDDSGEGIASEDLPHIFERFYRGEQARTRDRDGQRGAGLGLAIARGLVEAHRGTIEVVSQPGQGAQFSFTLPRRATV